MRHIFFLLCFWTSCGFAAIAQQVQDRPNILWIVSEDNTTMLGCYGDKVATTPNIDKFATEGVLYEHAFAQPACALSRSTLITGMLACDMGTELMRSNYPIPDFIKLFPKYLRQVGYYATNNDKEDYNFNRHPNTWDESSTKATYKNRKPGQPFFAVFNLGVTHESSIGIRGSKKPTQHDPEKVIIPPYLPATPEMKHDWAAYYDKIETMDQQVGKLLKELKEAGLAENTIVFYYSDNGGVLGRSKRFMYDSGLHVPLIIRFPKKYANIASAPAGSRIDRIVSFEDFAPSVLSLAGIKVPSYMQGKPFLGDQNTPEKEYAFGFRGRIDESLEMIRTIRSKKYRYIRNYMPHKIYGQHNEYYWETPSIVSWENSYKAGKLTPAQTVFWKAKPSEELFDTEADPYNMHNLAGDKKYQSLLEKMRKDCRDLMLKNVDAGFIPESMRVDISKTGTVYDYAHSSKYPLERIRETADMATSRNAAYLKELSIRLSDANAIVRYWAATGCTILGKQAKPASTKLTALLHDAVPAVQIAAAEAVYGLEGNAKIISVLSDALSSENQFVRVEALTVLEKMGKDAMPALGSIKQMAAQREDKKTAGEALWQAPHDVKIAKRIIANIG
ncbi:MAG: sulfatase [Sphingobacteriaceae bacterium]|jgi:arylsulfatase A-like enzyme|nr:sulfatase [Sphingobacteriaceae bacterium]